jgi:hypothetical protein
LTHDPTQMGDGLKLAVPTVGVVVIVIGIETGAAL